MIDRKMRANPYKRKKLQIYSLIIPVSIHNI
jgi:hypothetical protein